MPNKNFSRRVIDALLPEGALWEPKDDGDLDKHLDAIAENVQKVKDDISIIEFVRSPQKTSILSDLEKEFGIVPNPSSTEQERRDYLSAVKRGQNIGGTYDDLQNALREAGFDVYVTENYPTIDPSTIANNILANGDTIPFVSNIPDISAYWNSIFFVGGAATINIIGDDWTSRTAASAIAWRGVVYGGEVGSRLFVAVGTTGVGFRVMTSPDGITWTIRASSADNSWQSIIYANKLFVAASASGTNPIMTSSDGITWTNGVAPSGSWQGLAYGNGVFVAVGQGGPVMTSVDGINWSIGSSGNVQLWNDVTFNNGLFVAVAGDGTGNRVMTSQDGITWQSQTSAADNPWRSIASGGGLFVAVASSGTGNRVMTSPDGITWTIRASSSDWPWVSVTYGNGMFVAVAGSTAMFSLDGINWSDASGVIVGGWEAVTFGDGIFVAVTNNAVMTSDNQITAIATANVDADREAEFKTLILKYKPMHSWANLVVNFV